MKTPLILSCALALLVAGCSTEVQITKDENNPENDATAYFYLRDGSYIVSRAGEHPRIDAGYQVTGEVFYQDQSSDMFWTGLTHRDFKGTVRDGDIKVATQKRLNVPVGAALVNVSVDRIMRSGRD
jgi:hypothetical protein